MLFDTAYLKRPSLVKTPIPLAYLLCMVLFLWVDSVASYWARCPEAVVWLIKLFL
jgi:hypothetical protein